MLTLGIRAIIWVFTVFKILSELPMYKNRNLKIIKIYLKLKHLKTGLTFKTNYY